MKREARNRFAAAKKQARLKQQEELTKTNSSLNSSSELLDDNLNSMHTETSATETFDVLLPDHVAPLHYKKNVLPEGEEQLPFFQNGINSSNKIISNTIVQEECS